MVTEIEGNLVKLALQGAFEVVIQGNNAFCRQKSGLAPQMVEAFGTDKFPMEQLSRRGDINKLGQIDYEYRLINNGPKQVIVVNCYTQFKIKKFNEHDYPYTTEKDPLDYQALTLCLRKVNHIFQGKHIGLPQIGAGKARGDWNRIKQIIQDELTDCRVTVVLYKP